MSKIVYKPQGVCPVQLSFELNGDVVTDVAFVGGCNGNLKAISKLVDGWTVEKIEQYLRGNTCGMRPTSLFCACNRKTRVFLEKNAVFSRFNAVFSRFLKEKNVDNFKKF